MDGHIWTSPRGINPVIWSSQLYPASSRRESTTGQLTLAPPTSQWIISNSMLKVLRHSEKRSRTESHLPSRTPICSRNISMWPQSHNRDTHLTHSSLSITHTQLLKLCQSSQYRCIVCSLLWFDCSRSNGEEHLDLKLSERDVSWHLTDLDRVLHSSPCFSISDSSICSPTNALQNNNHKQ